MTHEEATLIIAKQLEPLYGQDPVLDSHITFDLGNSIFRCPNVETGYSTPAAKYLAKNDPKVTFEHIFSRKQSAITLIKAIRTNKSQRFLLRFIRSRCRVNISLRSENRQLVEHQQDSNIHPRATYKKAGLDWVRHEGPRKYIIEGKSYTFYDRYQILSEYNINRTELSRRVNYSGKKWAEWQVVKNVQ